MNNIDINYVFIIGGILFIMAELLLGVATGFDLLIIGVIMTLSGLVGFYTNSPLLSVISLIIFTILYLFVARKFVKKELAIKTKKTNVDAVIGEKGLVIKRIPKRGAGQIKVQGEVWRASSEEAIDEGKYAIVKSVSGVTLEVEEEK